MLTRHHSQHDVKPEQLDHTHAQADQQKKQLLMPTDQQVKQQERQPTQQYNAQLLVPNQ